MRELGRKGGRSRRDPAEQLPAGERESLREALRKGLDHETVVGAVKQSLAGGNESARIAAVRLLSDLELYRKEGDSCPRCVANAAEAPKAREKLDQLITSYVAEAMGVGTSTNPRAQWNAEHGSPAMKMIARAVAKAREGQDAELVALIEELLTKVRNGLKLADPDAKDCVRVFEGLEETGLIVRPWKVEELAQERLKVLKAEHGIP